MEFTEITDDDSSDEAKEYDEAQDKQYDPDGRDPSNIVRVDARVVEKVVGRTEGGIEGRAQMLSSKKIKLLNSEPATSCARSDSQGDGSGPGAEWGERVGKPSACVPHKPCYNFTQNGSCRFGDSCRLYPKCHT